MQQIPLPTLKEIRSHGTEAFPCATYQTRSTGKGVLVKHHWHEEIEILYFPGEKFRLEINMEPFPVRSECFYFINPGELHSIIAEKPGCCEENAVVFHPSILSFGSLDATQMQLISPICNGQLLLPRCILSGHPAFPPVREAFFDIMRSFGQPIGGDEPPFLEDCAPTDGLTRQLLARSSLLRIFACLCGHRLFIPAEKNYDKRVEGIKTILAYMKDNYKEKIYLKDLAAQVHMNEQYFSRFFKSAIGSPPMEYLNAYRIRQSIRLLEETDLPVMDVCLECGFHNMGNFLREFKKHTSATPLQYRTRCLAAHCGESHTKKSK